jgi:TctA family transporter
LIYVYIILLVIIALFEILILADQKNWRELMVAALIFLISLVYGLALAQDWQLPTLKEGVELIFAPVTHYLESIFD